jgi:NAD-reducing hydrogenase small subunit
MNQIDDNSAPTTELTDPKSAGKPRVATAWLDGCSGCHMSLLDIDEALVDVASGIELVYGPLVDTKEFPDNVDVALVEGAVSSVEHEELIRTIRSKTKILVSFGDCAVTANVPAIRNQFKVDDVIKRAYVENVTFARPFPTANVPALFSGAKPVHEIVPVDIFLPGCPPPADAILYLLSELLMGKVPDLSGKTRFGA